MVTNDVPLPKVGDHIEFVELCTLEPKTAWVTDLIQTSHGRAFIGQRPGTKDVQGERCWGYLAQITEVNGEEMP